MLTTSIQVRMRECWIKKDNLRESCTRPGWTDEPVLFALVVEHVKVTDEHQNKGHCKRFLEWLCADTRYDMVVVEGVQNPHLRTALIRWGWPYDKGVWDFYHARTVEAAAVLGGLAISQEGTSHDNAEPG